MSEQAAPYWANVTAKLGSLKPWDSNPKTSTKKDARALLKSWDELGQFQTVAIGPGGEVYDGHQRLSALLTVHGKDYEIVARQSDRPLTDEERRKIALYSRQIGAWDWDALSSWQPAELMEWGGFDADTLKTWKRDVTALDNFLKSEQPEPADAEPQIDRAEELREKWGVELGQMWQLGEHRLICGDCTDPAVVARVMGGERGTVFSDPPYGIDIVQNNKVGGENLAPVGSYAPIVGDKTTDTAKKFYATCREYGFVDFILWGGNYFTDFLPPSPCWIVWDKRGDMNSNNFADCELAWCSFDKPARVYKQVWAGMIREGESEKRVHPTQKPVKITADIMRDFPTDIYFDGFLGSGTTLIACENLSRKCRAIEISPAYVAVALQRWADLTGKTPELIDNGTPD